jgi:cytochrome c-type biogenesis protein CcsB
MEIINNFTIFFYLLSTAGYVGFLFFQKNALNKAGKYFLLAGFLCNTLAIIYGFVLSGQMPARDLRETLCIASWAVVCAFLLLQYKFQLKILGVYAAPLAAVIMIISYQLPVKPVSSPDLFKSFWLFLHIVFIFMGEAAFALACGVGFLYLLQERAIKSKRHGFFFKRLPSLDLLDTTGYICIISGFTLLTVGLIAGFVYAKSIWGKFWSADPKEIWSVITWLIYAILLHERLTVGWRGRRSAVMAIVGFMVVLFTFLGVNFLLKGHHGEFTRW